MNTLPLKMAKKRVIDKIVVDTNQHLQLIQNLRLRVCITEKSLGFTWDLIIKMHILQFYNI